MNEAPDALLSAEEASTVASDASALPVLLSVGERLHDAREAMGMSVDDVAKALKLSVRQIVALEQNDWSHLPGSTVTRGFVRNYARLLQLDVELLMHLLDAEQMPQQLPKLDLPACTNTPLPQTGEFERPDYAVVFAGLALVVFALLVYFFVPQDFWQATLGGLGADKKTVAVVAPTVDANPRDSSANVASIAALAPATVPSSLSATQPAMAGEQTLTSLPAAGSVTMSGATPVDTSNGLKLSFAQASWVEVRDRSGLVIFSQLSPAGSQREIEGQPPFALIVGNATHVTVQYKGKVVDMPSRSKDDVARLTLE